MEFRESKSDPPMQQDVSLRRIVPEGGREVKALT